jgi:hypothetical protein
VTEVLAETQEQPEAFAPTGVLAPCAGCGHAHYAHRGALGTGQAICLAAVPAKRDGSPPGHGEYTTGHGSVHHGGSVCACNGCRCVNCGPRQKE